MREHVALLAENGEVAAGLRARPHAWGAARLDQRSLREPGLPARRAQPAGSCATRPRRCASEGADVIELDVRPWNDEARAVYERWGFRESKLTLADEGGGPRGASLPGGACAVPRARVRADGRRDARREGRPGLRATAGPLGSHGRPPAGERLDRGRRRAVQRRPEPAAPPRAGALLPHRWRCADARGGGGSRRAVRPVRPGLRRRRVLLAPRVPRAAAARRRRRPEREPDRGAPADRSRPSSACARSRRPPPLQPSCLPPKTSTRSSRACWECRCRDHAL